MQAWAICASVRQEPAVHAASTSHPQLLPDRLARIRLQAVVAYHDVHLGQGHDRAQPQHPPLRIIGHYFFLYFDAAYAKEASAYTKLATLHRDRVPRHYGTYTANVLELSADAVRVILIEFVHGCAVRGLDPRQFSQPAL